MEKIIEYATYHYYQFMGFIAIIILSTLFILDGWGWMIDRLDDWITKHRSRKLIHYDWKMAQRKSRLIIRRDDGIAALEVALLLPLLIPVLGLMIDGSRIYHAQWNLERAANVCAEAGIRDIGHWELVDNLPTFITDGQAGYNAAAGAVGLVLIDKQPPVLEEIIVDEPNKSVKARLSHQFAPIMPVPLNIKLTADAIQIRAN